MAEDDIDLKEHDWLSLGMDPATDAPVAEAKPAPVPVKAEPAAPAAAKAAEPKPAAPAPAVPAQPAAAAPKNDDPKPPQGTQPSSNQDFVKELLEKQKATDESIRLLVEENAKLIEALGAQAQPKLNPEELAAKEEEEREALLANPKAYLEKQKAELTKQLTAEAGERAKEETAKSLGYETVREFELAVASNLGVRRLSTDKEQYPLMADPEFRKEMGLNENLNAVLKRFQPKDGSDVDAVEVLRRQEFWQAAYDRANLARMAKLTNAGGTPTEAAPGTDEPLPIPSGGPSAPAAKPTAVGTTDDPMWAEIEAVGADALR